VEHVCGHWWFLLHTTKLFKKIHNPVSKMFLLSYNFFEITFYTNGHKDSENIFFQMRKNFVRIFSFHLLMSHLLVILFAHDIDKIV
jgi:hypothetical protein